MAEFEPVEFRSTLVRFTPQSHARFATWAKNSKMTRSEFAKYLMNAGVKVLREKERLAALMTPDGERIERG